MSTTDNAITLATHVVRATVTPFAEGAAPGPREAALILVRVAKQLHLLPELARALADLSDQVLPELAGGVVITHAAALAWYEDMGSGRWDPELVQELKAAMRKAGRT